MTLEEARALVGGGGRPEDREPITVRRSGTTWTGRVQSVMARPSLILRKDDGCSVALALDGLTVVEEP